MIISPPPFFFSFGIGFVIVLDLTKTKTLSGMTYHHNEVFCKCFIHVSFRCRFVTVTRQCLEALKLVKNFEGTEILNSQDFIVRCFPFS